MGSVVTRRFPHASRRRGSACVSVACRVTRQPRGRRQHGVVAAGVPRSGRTVPRHRRARWPTLASCSGRIHPPVRRRRVNSKVQAQAPAKARNYADEGGARRTSNPKNISYASARPGCLAHLIINRPGTHGTVGKGQTRLARPQQTLNRTNHVVRYHRLHPASTNDLYQAFVVDIPQLRHDMCLSQTHVATRYQP